MSALLTTTMSYMKTVIDGFRAAGLGHVKMAVGGAPVSRRSPTRSAPTATREHAPAAVDLFHRLAARP